MNVREMLVVDTIKKTCKLNNFVDINLFEKDMNEENYEKVTSGSVQPSFLVSFKNL